MARLWALRYASPKPHHSRRGLTQVLDLTGETFVTAKLPYFTSPGSVKTALDKIRSAATPSRVTQDFVNTVLQIKGGTGASIPPFLKKIGLVASDGTPTELYKQFRNPATGGAAIAKAILHGYGELSRANEYFYKLNEKELNALIVQVTGLSADDRVVTLIASTLKTLKSYANFDVATPVEPETNAQDPAPPANHDTALPVPGLNLTYTINLNLPATSDQAVFNAIFKSLKEHLLSNG